MARPDYNLCDRCGKKSVGKRIFVFTDRRMDGAGSMEDVGDTIDLCGECAVDAVCFLVANVPEGFLEWLSQEQLKVTT